MRDLLNLPLTLAGMYALIYLAVRVEEWVKRQ